MGGQAPPGWYQDPHDPNLERYWSGAEWTDDRRPPTRPRAGAKPASYLAFAIVVTLLCCLPFGIVAIVHAARVDSLWATGDVAGAQRASQLARNWSIAAMVSLPILAVLWLAIVAAAGAGAVLP